MPPGTLGCPFFGSNIFSGNPVDGPEAFFGRQSAKLGNPRVWKYRFWGNDAIFVSGAEDISKIMGQEFTESLASPTSQRFIVDPFAGTMSNNFLLFEQDRAKHRRLRDFFIKSIGQRAVIDRVPEIQQICDGLLDRVIQTGQLKMEDVCAEFVLDITQKMLLGLD